MKMTSKIFLIAILFLAGLVSVQAQRGGGGNFNDDPEKMAERQTTHMVSQLELNETQAAKVKEINLAYAKKRQEARAQASGDRAKMQETMKQMRDQKNDELKGVFTEAQYQKWQEVEGQGRGQQKGQKPGHKKGQRKGPRGAKS